MVCLDKVRDILKANMNMPILQLLPRGFIDFSKSQNCSFCNKPRSEVPRLFSNGMSGESYKTICTDCVAESTKLIAEPKAPHDN